MIKKNQTPYCFKEKKKFKLFEFTKFKPDNFWKCPKKYLTKQNNTLFISGPARHGNHLLYSLLDGHKEIQNAPGEDDMLRLLFSHLNKNEVLTKSKIKKNEIKFIMQLSCQNYKDKKNLGYDKWKAVSTLLKKNKVLPIWSGTQPEGQGHIQDFKNHIPNIKYSNFKKYLSDKKNYKTFFDFWYTYMNALKILTNRKKENIKYQNIWFGSGLRRELFFLLKKVKNIKVVSPIREFPGFYYSYCLPRYGKVIFKKKIIKDAWQHWKHKVIDYLILKKIYPSNIVIIKYEDLVLNTNHIMKKVAINLDIKFNRNLLKPTLLKKKTFGNSSFKIHKEKAGAIYTRKKNNFDLNLLPKEYNKILAYIEKVKL